MKKIARLFFIVILFVSCADKYKVIEEKVVLPQAKTNQDDVMMKDSVSGIYFSRLSKPTSYGLIYRYYPPENIRDKDIKIVFSGNARTNYAYSNANVSASVNSVKNDMLMWSGINLRYYFTNINTWCPFKDSLRIKRETWQNPIRCISVFAGLGYSASEHFDIDTLKIQISVKED